MLARIMWKRRRGLQAEVLELCSVIRRIGSEVVGRKLDWRLPSERADGRQCEGNASESIYVGVHCRSDDGGIVSEGNCDGAHFVQSKYVVCCEIQGQLVPKRRLFYLLRQLQLSAPPPAIVGKCPSRAFLRASVSPAARASEIRSSDPAAAVQ